MNALLREHKVSEQPCATASMAVGAVFAVEPQTLYGNCGSSGL
jgi:hypothetical protein